MTKIKKKTISTMPDNKAVNCTLWKEMKKNQTESKNGNNKCRKLYTLYQY